MAQRSRKISDPVKAELVAALREQLAEGERIAWASSPEVFEPEERDTKKLEALALVGGGYLTLGAIVLAVFQGNWLWLSAPLALLAIGVIAFLVIAAKNARAKRAFEGTIYGFTTRRALIVHTYPALTVRTLPIEAITDVTLSDARDGLATLTFQAASPSASLVFRQISEPERTRTQLQRVIRDPQATEQEIAAAEAYAKQMMQLRMRSAPS